ncbi:MAG: serine/threonine-protein kinase PknK, partial [Anaerolineae bacterium]
GRGGMGAVYRASDLLTGQTVAIKRVTTPAEDLSFSTYPTAQGSEGTRIALAHEFEMLASLRHPNIISVLDYGFAELLENPQAGRVPYLSMDYLASGRTILEAAKGQTTARRVEMLVEALQALAYLHRRGIEHRDIKPGNILVEGPGSDNPGRVRVLDFGLSIQQETALGGEIAGTLIYLAPELIRRRSPQPPSPLSDLYAMGLIAYEMFAGRHPIEADSISQILLPISRKRPDLSAIKAPPGIVAVIGRLLEKDPESRYPSAEATLIALSDAIDRPIPVETDAIRESYLQAATFVGREQELGSLLTALQAARQGRGSAFLIGGESGVGKSRQVAELRTRAMVAGVTVLRGQAVGDSAQPFLVWRDPARILSLSQDIDPLTASVFKPVIPDIERLLGFDIPDAPDLGGAEDQARLQIALVRLLREMDEPALLVLEDLHWATPESLEALKRVVTVAEGLPLLVVGTFRDDEAPDLPGRLPGMEVIGLNRLSSDEIAMLSGAMLGSSGRDPQVLDLLRKETEGNAFFLVEVVRALAEEAGSLRDVAAMTLPVSVFAEGIQTIVRRRLERVPPPHDLLRLLAIAGRRGNPALIDRLAPDLDRDAWLAASANAAVLEQNAGQWQFAHDKLREQLLADLREDERPTLHRRVAEAIEALHPGDATRAGQLADLWGAAGETERERQYSITAARSAAATGFYQEAVPRFNRAVTLTPQAQRADLLVGLGQAQLGISQYDAAETTLMAALGLLPADSPLVAQALTTLGMVHGSRGEYDEAAARYQEAIASAQRPQDAIRARIGLAKTAITQGDLETGQALAQDALE